MDGAGGDMAFSQKGTGESRFSSRLHYNTKYKIAWLIDYLFRLFGGLFDFYDHFCSTFKCTLLHSGCSDVLQCKLAELRQSTYLCVGGMGQEHFSREILFLTQ